MLQVDKAPRGRNQQARFYQDHARPNEDLFVVVLPGGRLGKINGVPVASGTLAPLEALEARHRSAREPRWTIERRTLEHGTKIHRF